MTVFYYTILDELISSLQQDFVCTSQDTVGTFLGIDIHHTANGFLELTQQGLTNKIITACGLQDQSAKHSTPANSILTDDIDSPAHEHHWNYRSIIGMLTYLSSSTISDIDHSSPASLLQHCTSLYL
jgi:hypothetical protein